MTSNTQQVIVCTNTCSESFCIIYLFIFFCTNLPILQERVPNYGNMFSDNPHHPSHGYRMKLDRYRSTRMPPPTHVESGISTDLTRVASGSQRYKFFTQPLMPKGQMNDVIIDESSRVKGISEQWLDKRLDGDTEQQTISFHAMREPRVKDAGTQSDYRENEAQTIPYTPEYSVPDGEDPEVLALTELKCDEHGTFRIDEDALKIIDRVRRRRAVESQLPSSGDMHNFEARLNMLRELEMVEWKEREEQIAEQQMVQLNLLRERLEHREKERERLNSERIQKLQRDKFAEMEYKLEQLEMKKLKGQRKIVKRHDNPENKFQRRDIILEHAFPASRLHVPFAREGWTGDFPIADDIRPIMLSSAHTIDQVGRAHSRGLASSAIPSTEVAIRAAGIGSLISAKNETEYGHTTSKQRKEQEIRQDIERAKKRLTSKTQLKSRVAMNTLRELYKATPRIARPPTPTLEVEDEEDELDNAVILIQRLLRGRSVQIVMEEGKDRSISLIDELIAVERVKDLEKYAVGGREDDVKREKRERNEMMRVMADNIQGQIISRALDYLSKELVRHGEMKKIEQLMARAEMDRTIREREEMKLRQHEEAVRLREDKEYEQLMSMNDSTISTFIDQMFQETSDRLSNRLALEQGRKQIQSTMKEVHKRRQEEVKQRQLDDENEMAVTSGHGSRAHTPSTDELEIRDLVASFLLPQVKRSSIRQRVEHDQRKHILAVHETIMDTLNKISEQ